MTPQPARTSTEQARALSTEQKRTFWRGIREKRLDFRDARIIAGIKCPLVATRLFIQCHTADDVPMNVEDIK